MLAQDRALPAARCPERRDDVARTLRNELARLLGIHPREIAGLQRGAAARTLARLAEQQLAIEALTQRVSTDDLTGALRRASGLAALDRILDRARVGRQRVVVAFVDLDGLKTVNDTSGHAAGDQLLKRVAVALRERIRPFDLLIRWGGDEFLCVLPDAGEIGTRRLLAGPNYSLGVAAWDPAETMDELIHRADQDLYFQRGRREPDDPPHLRPEPREVFGAPIDGLFLVAAGSARDR